MAIGSVVATSAISTVFYSMWANSHIGRVDGLVEPQYVREPRAKVSLIVPALNEEKYLPLLLTSAENQTEPIHEIIVADSSEDDLTANVAYEYGGRVIKMPRCNPATARNAGANLASGDILLFCDADVILYQHFTEDAISMLLDRYMAVHPREVIYDSQFWNSIQFIAMGPFRPRDYTSRSVAVSRYAFDTIGGYDELCDPRGDPPCREDLTLGRNIVDTFGKNSINVMPGYIATSGRRMKKFGFKSADLRTWKNEARSRIRR